MTQMLNDAIRAARALPDSQQDAIAACIFAAIEDERRRAESFKRSPNVLAQLAREALDDGRSPQDLGAEYAAMAADGPREADAAAWANALMSDFADESDNDDGHWHRA